MLICMLLTIAFLLPIVMTLMTSFMSSEEVSVVFNRGHAFRWIPYNVTLESYWELLFASEIYLATFWNSMFIASISAVLQVIISLTVGYGLARARFKGKNIVAFLYICIMLTPFQVTLLPNYILSKELNLYNTWGALILPAAFAPMGAFLIKQFISEVPGEVFEAAHIDTSSNLRVIFTIALPLVKAGILTVGVIAFAESWNMVEQPLILLDDEWLYPLSLRLHSLADDALNIKFSGAVLYMVPAVLLYMLFKNELIEGIKHMKL